MGALGVILLVVVVLVVVVLLVVGWFVCGQNNLVHAEELCGNALSQIGVQQASRWDALNALADLTKGYSDQEYNTLMDTIRARQGISPKSSAAEVDAQENLLQQGLGRINALAEAYPDLKSNTVYLKTMDEVRRYEDNVRMSRMVYNDTVTKYNRLVRSLPGSLLATGLGFAPRGYLQDDPAKAGMPTMVR
ncbi:LemA family protein [Ruminococcaceae bacterium OttesenSCG-928-O06]|nr:LemA family protein [Ruminococcaceae bacterium OttesenSCG-928-O06]